MSNLVIDSKGNPFENLDELQYSYLHIALTISAYCNGDYDAKMPCSQDEWDDVVKYEGKEGISSEKSLTNWLKVSS